MLHILGEQFFLNALFQGGPTNLYIPAFYYLGLDNRPTLFAADTMSGLVGEPSANGYLRQPVSSTTDFTVELVNGVYRASSANVTFRALGGSWGPVQNIFITDRVDLTGTLIASANLGSPFSLSAGNTVSLRIGIALRDCPS